ncbi:MAG: tRNA lysidine(34) synthetase TilS [Ignavibacteria bacterium CG2_30_36_16]|nr:MAG: tRNA lysidine(34) synthetase TilS [Ignavibacteria bacterium CG2_30_36_16]
MKTTEQKVLKFIDEKKLISKYDRVLVALSGGSDSVFLLHMFCKYKNKFKLEIGALHINHKLRGEASDKDEEYCKSLCSSLSVEFFSIKKDVKDYSSKNKISIEEAGRIIRYTAFERIAKKNNYNKIATGHHADDNAETVLLNFVKGAGPKGLSGIPYKRGKIIRPLLVLSKNEIQLWLKNKNIETMTDETNLNSDFERNYLRNEIISRLKEKFNPSLEATFFRTSEIFRLQSELIARLSHDVSEKSFYVSKHNLHLILKELSAVHPAIISASLKEKIEETFDTVLNFNDVKKVLTLINNQRGHKTELPKGIICFREKDELIFCEDNSKELFEPVSINIGGTVEAFGKKISIKKVKKVDVSFKIGTEYLNGEKFTGNKFVLRVWQPGDKFIPLGMKGYKKISDFLTDQKISSNKKKEQLVLLHKEQIVWVVGLRIDNRFKLADDTRKVLQLCIK